MWDLLFVKLTASGLTVTGTGAAVILSTWGIVYKMNRDRKKDTMVEIDKKADKIYVDGKFENYDIEIDNLKEAIRNINVDVKEIRVEVQNGMVIIENRISKDIENLNTNLNTNLNNRFGNLIKIIELSKNKK